MPFAPKSCFNHVFQKFSFCLFAFSKDHTTGHSLPTLGGPICLFLSGNTESEITATSVTTGGAPPTAFSDWAGMGNKISFFGMQNQFSHFGGGGTNLRTIMPAQE